jgi:hypothetical protein
MSYDVNTVAWKPFFRIQGGGFERAAPGHVHPRRSVITVTDQHAQGDFRVGGLPSEAFPLISVSEGVNFSPVAPCGPQ